MAEMGNGGLHSLYNPRLFWRVFYGRKTLIPIAGTVGVEHGYRTLTAEHLYQQSRGEGRG
jgi:hypothetical protein